MQTTATRVAAAPVTLRGVGRAFGALAVLDGIDLDVGAGEVVALLGASGCGKSTLLRLVGGLDRPTSGDVLIDGARVAGIEPRAAVVFQEPRLLPWRTLAENVAFGLPDGGTRAERQAEVERARSVPSQATVRRISRQPTTTRGEKTWHSTGPAADVEIVNLQHSDGKIALERGDVAAWAGLDPFMAQTELEAGSRLVYRNLDFNSYGLLNAGEEFLEQKPELAQTVVNAYERARAWIRENPDAAVQTLATAASIKPEIARQQLLTRTQLDIDPVPGEPQRAVLARLLPLLVADGLVRSEQEAQTALDTLLEPRFAEQARGIQRGCAPSAAAARSWPAASSPSRRSRPARPPPLRDTARPTTAPPTPPRTPGSSRPARWTVLRTTG